ncbi:S8 family serine peptidase [Actinokineospora enzanensis]|uniref:S8 family serine peptidase n=1 Tax=Actinokineospora enzanensis TaxID=155975 RepID=UPI000379A75A|nr:S8 family serine peptidase [Actinokineospora enzanensis]
MVRLAAVTIALGGVLSGVQLVPAFAAPPAVATAGGRAVTLLTGDRVVVDTLGHRQIQPGPNRGNAMFSLYEQNGHHFVVPVEALTPINEGRVDERLFDIDGLLADGYDDAHSATLPVIVTYQPGIAPVALAGVASSRNLAAVNGSAIEARRDGSAWSAVANPGVRKVWLDGVRKPLLDKSAVQINAPAAWTAGYTGTGVKVALLDSGIDTTHPDLATQVAAEQNFTGSGDDLDRLGHGTHLASIIAGNNAKYRGIANGATLLDGKILDDNGTSRDSWIIAGMQWAVDQGAKVVNLSIGDNDLPGVDPLEDAVNTLSAQHNTLFVVAAGNGGANPGTIDSPASADAALTVGAVDRADKIASFSSRGPRIGDGAVKPDITAPGVGIVAARSAASVGDGRYVSDTGTSMSAAHVAGAAAVLSSQHPDWTGEQLKDVLMASAKPGQQQTIFQEGTGRVDVGAAIAQQVSSSPASVHMGLERLPDTGGQDFTRKVTYRNTGTADTTLDLKIVLLGPDGKLTSMATVTPSKLDIPAGGTATATYAVNPATATLQGVYGGLATATGPAGTVRTPIAFVRAEQTFEMTVDQIGLDGYPAVNGTVTFISKAPGAYRYPVTAAGRVRLPKGEYSVSSALVGENVDWLFQPTFTVTADAKLTVDYRQAKQLRIAPPDHTARSTFADVALNYGDLYAGFAGTDITRTFTGTIGDPAPGNAVTYKIQSQWVGDDGDFYGLAYFGHGSLPAGLDKHPSKRDLAHVRADLRGTNPGNIGLRGAGPFPVEGSVMDSNPGYQAAALPFARDEYYTTEKDGAAWVSELVQMPKTGTTPEAVLISPLRRYRAGHDYRETYNQGVFAPSFPPVPKGQSYIYRTKDTLRGTMSLFGDGAGNAGDAPVASKVTTLYQGDTKLGESTDPTQQATFAMPAADGTYKLVADVVRAPGTTDVSTHVTASWTFPSSHTDVTTPIVLSTLRVSPNLDQNNTSLKGRPFAVPFSLQQQGSTDTQAPRTLKVEASYDGGKTWQKVPVLFGTAFLWQPNQPGTVSLHAVATDKAGQTEELTVIDAYKLR